MSFLVEEDPKKTNLPVVMVFVGLLEILINGYLFYVSDGFSSVTLWWSLHGIVVIFYGLFLVQVKRRKGSIGRIQIIFGECLLWLMLAVFGYFMYLIRGITSLG